MAGSDSDALSEALGRTGRGLRAPNGDPTLEGALGLLLDELTFVEGVPGSSAYARGVGWRLHWILCRTVYQPWRADEVIESAPEGLRASFRAGYQAAARAGRHDGRT